MKKKVLIVEDEMALSLALRRTLYNDYDVYVAEDGVRALELIEEKEFDLILLDLSMPRMTGQEFLQELKRRDADEAHRKCVLVLSNGNLPDDIPKGEPCPVAGFLRKADTSLEDLHRHVREMIGKQSYAKA